MAVEIGTVQTFPDVKPDKAQALKVLEEAAEVFGAWQLGRRGRLHRGRRVRVRLPYGRVRRRDTSDVQFARGLRGPGLHRVHGIVP